jgi:hypothetical protein
MEQIRFEEKDEFVSVTAVPPEDAGKEEAKPVGSGVGDENGLSSEVESSQNTDEAARSNLASTVGDSVRTEPLDEDEAEFCEHHQ